MSLASIRYLWNSGGLATGIPKIIRAMRENGSPPAEFEVDDDHSYFSVRLPVHPAALEVAESVAGEEATLPVGTKSGPSRDEVLVLQQAIGETSIPALMAAARRTNRTKFGNGVSKPTRWVFLTSGIFLPKFAIKYHRSR